jgi:hypothetical protein
MAKFDSKSFNPQAFGKYVDRIPNTTKSEIAKSGAIGTNQNAHNALSNQTGSLYARVPYFGRISGTTSQNNDGGTNITSSNTTTYEQGFITASRMDGWTEKSFSKSITAGVDFMDNVAAQIADYKLEVKQAIALAILDGVYSMNTIGTGVAAKAASEFINKHTYDVTGSGDGVVTASTLNSAIQKACGDNKGIFKLAFMHSEVATNLENMKLLKYMTYTDADGITKDLAIATWNGRTVIIDDGVPTGSIGTTAGVYTVTIGGTVVTGEKFSVAGAEFTVDTTQTPTAVATGLETALASNANYTVSRSGAVLTLTEKTGKYGVGKPDTDTDSVAGTVTVATTTEPVVTTTYTTYVMGEGSIIIDDIGDEHPYEMSRDPKTNGGQDTLYVRDRFICGVDGISFEKPASITASASNTDLATGTNWNIINDGTKAIPHKAIALCKIVSKG